MSVTMLLPPATAVKITWARTTAFSSDDARPKTSVVAIETLLKEIKDKAGNDDLERAYVYSAIASMDAFLRNLETIYKGRELRFNENEKIRSVCLESVQDNIAFGNKAKDFLKSLWRSEMRLKRIPVVLCLMLALVVCVALSANSQTPLISSNCHTILISAPHKCAAITPVDSTPSVKPDIRLSNSIYFWTRIKLRTAVIDSVQKEFDKDDKAQKIKTELGMSFSSNESDQHKSLYEVITDAKINRGIYPQVMNFEMRSAVQYKDDKLSENVSALKLNYNYFLRPRWMVYAFMERFADDFMSIDQRYEVGFGLELHIKTFGELKQMSEKIAYIRALPNLLDTLPDTTVSQDTTLKRADVREFMKKVEQTRTSVEMGARRLSFGIAFTLFEELERATIEANFTDNATGTTSLKEYPLPPSRCYRVVMRPKVVWNVNDQLTIEGYSYFKFKYFDEPNRDIHLRRDWRSDSFLTAELNLSGKDDPSNGCVKLALNIENSFDNSPPEIPAKTVREASGTINPIAAARNHLMVSLEIKIKLE